MKDGHGCVSLLHHHDILTEAKWLRRCVEVCYRAELQEALIECHLEWRSPAGGISSAPSSPSKRRAIELEGETLRHSHNVALVRTIITLKGGLHARKTFNDSHRCRDTR